MSGDASLHAELEVESGPSEEKMREQEAINDEDLLEFEFDLTNILAQSQDFELDDSQLVETFKNYKSLYNEFNENVSRLLNSELDETDLFETVNKQLETINKSFEISSSAAALAKATRIREPVQTAVCHSDSAYKGKCSACKIIEERDSLKKLLLIESSPKLPENDYYRLMFAEKSARDADVSFEASRDPGPGDQAAAAAANQRKLSSSVTYRFNSTSSTPQVSTRIRFFQETMPTNVAAESHEGSSLRSNGARSDDTKN